MATGAGQPFAVPARGTTQLYVLPEPPALAPALEQQFAGWLSADERQRWQRFHHATDRQRFLLARALVRRVLAQLLQQSPAVLQFSRNRHGKPALSQPADTALKFNISHTHGLLVLAVTMAHEVGVDVETVTRDVGMLALADRFFAGAEVAMLRRLPAPQLREAFFRLWTLKEAYVKACGLGLQLGLDSFVIDLAPSGHARLAEGGDVGGWSLFCDVWADGFCVATAVNTPHAVLQYIDLTVDSLAA